MIWIAEVHIKNSDNHLVKIIEIASRKMYSINQFLVDVNAKINTLCSVYEEETGEKAGYEITNIHLEPYRERIEI